jgi:hypothetical protein
MVEEITISSHNRNLEVLTNSCNLHRILSKPEGAREQILSLAQANGGVLDFTGGLTVYVPINFSFFDSMSTAIPVEFVEQLEVFVKLGAGADYFFGTGVPSVTSMDLICNYYAMSEKNMRDYLSAQYSVERPLSQKLKSCFEETPVNGTAVNNTDVDITMDLKSKNVLEYSLLSLHKTTATAAGTGKSVLHVIKNIRWVICQRNK